jgi:hypothetical protein
VTERLRVGLVLALATFVLAGCAAPRGATVQPTGSSARAATDSRAMGDALDQACQDAARKLSVRGDLAVAPATEGAWTLMAASDLAGALRARGARVRLVDRDLAAVQTGVVVVVKTTYVAVDAYERRIPLSKWSLLEDADVTAGLAGAVAAISLVTAITQDLGHQRGGCASVTAYAIDPASKRTLEVVSGFDQRPRW